MTKVGAGAEKRGINGTRLNPTEQMDQRGGRGREDIKYRQGLIMIGADGTSQLEHNSAHKEADFQSKTGSNRTGDEKQGESRKKIPKT